MLVSVTRDKLVQALLGFINTPNNPIHPLALGNVKRHHARSKLVARKLLLKHMKSDEAKSDLDLKVDLDTSPEILDAMWGLYLQYRGQSPAASALRSKC